jgi:ABC-2 type transport system ATP-binding protein
MTAAVETFGLVKRYRKVEALRGLDLAVPAGTVCGFLGPNGAGKTSTMRILMGLSRPTAGTARVLGAPVGSDGLAIRSRVGYLGQDPSFYPRFRVRTVLQFVARRYLTGPRRDIESRVDETLEQVGLADRAKRRVKALSGGERQRLGIGQAVIGRPELLILDEPSVGLDPEGRFQVLSLIDSLRDQMTVFYSSHILDDVQRIADHVVILDRGRVIEQGPMDHFLGSGARYRVALDGKTDADPAGSLQNLRWVSDVSRVGDAKWDIAVTDRTAAENELLAALAGRHGSAVTEFRPLVQSLEDIYMAAVVAGDSEEVGHDD